MKLWSDLSSPLVQRALLEGVLVGALCGAVGAHVVLRRLSFFTLALSHASFPGVVVASMLGLSISLGGAAAAAALIVAVAVVGSAPRLDASTATGVVLAGAFALGVALQSAQQGGSRDLTAFLVGDIVTVGPSDIAATAAVGAVALAVLALLHKELVFGAFDPDGAEAAGLRTLVLDLVVLATIAAVVVTSVRAVGTILVVALLAAPALAARARTTRVAPMMLAGAALGAAAGAIGIAASTQWEVAGGASITLASAALLALALLVPARHRDRLRAAR